MTRLTLPTNLLDEQKGKICGVLSAGCDRDTAANLVGCSIADLRRAMRHDHEFAAQVRRTEAGAELEHMRTVKEAAKEPKNWRASVWWMERRAPDRFGPRSSGSLTPRQLDDFLSIVADIICNEIDSRDDRRRVMSRMGEAVRELDQLVRWSSTASAAGLDLAPAEETFSATNESSSEEFEYSDEDFE